LEPSAAKCLIRNRHFRRRPQRSPMNDRPLNTVTGDQHTPHASQTMRACGHLV
jgi:hypothetical protein